MRKEFIEDKIWIHKSSDECRWWLHWGNTIWHYEGYLGKSARHNSIGLNLGGEENDFTFHMGIGKLFNFYFGVEDFFPRKMMQKLFGFTTRHYGISAFEEYISIEFHRDDMGFSEGWKGFHKMIDWKSILFGKTDYKHQKINTLRASIEMPEGKYPATINVFKSTWTRKRFLKPLVLTRYEITPDIPIPEPGKGESTWDIDDDALYSITLPADNLGEALNRTAESVMKTRRKRAGENWIPANGFEINAQYVDKAKGERQ